MSREKVLRRLGEGLGFDRVGLASLGPAETGSSFLRWLAGGAQAGMSYLERKVEKRLDPRQVLPGARSAICVALRYAPLESSTDSEPGGDLWPGVARYAHGRDYHDVMSARLSALEEEIAAAFPGVRTRRYVDTGPILERELAAKAGLGAFGKNCNLLDPEMGSWFLIGEVLTTLDLDGDSSQADLCGSCTLCLEACPTEALTEPYRLDSNLCISYWTIEHRGSVPEPMRSQIGEWVFGCDVCQEVCPANTDLAAASHPELCLPDERGELDLAALAVLPRDDYVELFRGSPMKRAKLEGLKRNACIAMGNRADARYLEPLLCALEDEDAVVRSQAAWALARLNLERGEDAARRRKSLQAARDREVDRRSLDELRAALGAVESTPAGAAG